MAAAARALWVIAGALATCTACQRGPSATAVLVTDWEARWHAARDCYLGTPRAAASAEDAFAVQRLVHGYTYSFAPCSKLLAATVRPRGKPSGNDAIEQAFAAIDTAIDTITHTRDDDDQLGGQLAIVERGEARLRAAAELPPLAPPTGAVTITALVDVPPIAGSDHRVWQDVIARGHAITGKTFVADDQDPRTAVARPGELREAGGRGGTFAGDRSWHATSAADPDDSMRIAITAGPPDAFAYTGPYQELTAVLGTGARRAIVLWNERVVSLVRSQDGGAHWAAPTTIATDAFAWPDLLGNAVDMITGDGDHPLWTRLVDGGPVPAARPSGIRPVSRLTCFADAMWILTEEEDGKPAQLWHVDGTAAVRLPHDFAYSHLEACSADAAIVSDDADGKWRCTSTTCVLALTGAVARVDVDDAGGVIAASQQSDVVEVRRGDRDRTYVRVPAGVALVGVVAAPGHGALAINDASGLRFVPLP